MKEKKEDEGFVLWVFKALLVSGPLLLAETVLGFVQDRQDIRVRVAIYGLIGPVVILTLFFLRWIGGEMSL